MVEGAESHAAYGELLLDISNPLATRVFVLRADEIVGPLRFIVRSVWTCVGALAILDRLDVVDLDSCSWWLCERQLPNGGLNGRPEKLEDVGTCQSANIWGWEGSSTILTILPNLRQVCYSWWVIASLAILKRSHWIDGAKLSSFILSAQVSNNLPL